MSSPLLSLLVIILAIVSASYRVEAETITVNIYADNYFDFYYNGDLIHSDPLDFTPHNGVQFTFDHNEGDSKTYAIRAKDFATPSGFEYTLTDQPQLGDGALRVSMSDGTITNSEWKCFTTSYGPTGPSEENGCSASNLDACEIQLDDEPEDWTSPSFDDSDWEAATEYTEEEAGWGMTPRYQNGKCGSRTSPFTRDPLEPTSIETDENDCLDPKNLDWGDSVFIWQPELKRDNIVLCRFSNADSEGPESDGPESTPEGPSDAEPQSEEPAPEGPSDEEPQSEEPAPEPQSEEPAPEPQSEEPSEEPQSEEPSEEPQSEEPAPEGPSADGPEAPERPEGPDRPGPAPPRPN